MNILITANCRIRSGRMYRTNTDAYNEIHSLCISSYERNLKDLDESIVIGGDFDCEHAMFHHICSEVDRVYHSGNHNVVWSDTDMLVRKPVDLFFRWPDFRMVFQWQALACYPRQVPVDIYAHQYPWQMSNLRIYPAGMRESIWEAGRNITKNWINVWAFECIAHNAMYRAQDIQEHLHMPELNYQCVACPENGPMNPRDACIWHCHSSRGADRVLALMKNENSIILEGSEEQ